LIQNCDRSPSKPSRGRDRFLPLQNYPHLWQT
jgi:hypothetical protein